MYLYLVLRGEALSASTKKNGDGTKMRSGVTVEARDKEVQSERHLILISRPVLRRSTDAEPRLTSRPGP